MKQSVREPAIIFILIFATIPLSLSIGDLRFQVKEEMEAPEDIDRVSHSKETTIHREEVTTALVDNKTTIDWIKKHQKPDSGYGRLDNPWSHISWVYSAVHSLYILNKMRNDDYAKLSNPSQTITWLHNQHHSDFEFEWVYSLILLDSGPNDKENEINDLSSIQLTYYENYESGDLLNSLQVAWTLDLLGAADRANRNNVTGLKSRQLPDGGWNRLSPNEFNDYDNVQNNKSLLTYTWYAVKLHDIFNETIANQEILLDWVASTQAENGGFALFPVDESRDGFSGITDVYYTWCALSIYYYFNDFSRINREKALEYLNSLQNYNGGFGDKPGWNSRLYSTFWAIASIDMLGGTITPKLRAEPQITPIPEDGSIRPYVWASQQDSYQYWGYYPSEAMLLGERYNIALLGRKDAYNKVAYVADANEYARYYNLQIRAIFTPEGYGSSFHVNGLMENSHRWYYFSNRSHKGWPNTKEFYFNWTTWRSLLDKVHDEGGYCYFAGWKPSLDETYYVMDDSILNKRGYLAIAGSSLSTEDKVRVNPWLEKYIGVVPFIAEQDAHNDVFKEIKKINKVRSIFLAPNGTWAGLIDAFEKNRIATVFMDSPRVIYGTNETVTFLRKHLDWSWNNKYDGQISVVPVTHGNYQLGIPNNDYERPSWDPTNSTHFGPNFKGIIIKIKSRAKSLDFISFDDSPNISNMTLVESPRKEIQSYYWINIKNPTNGTHTISIQYTHTNESQVWYNVTFSYNSDLGRGEGDPPTVTVLSPNGGEVWTGVNTIQWTANDPDEDPLSYTLYYGNGNTNWTEIETGLSATSFEWNTKQVPDGTGYIIKIIAADGHFSREDVSDLSFTIMNQTPVNSEKSLWERIRFLSMDKLLLFLDIITVLLAIYWIRKRLRKTSSSTIYSFKFK
ncbi:MAG: prenyltransferase/squalene oxidase repeat-containing protein [Candidatus Hodarchaeota archaeon]